jgi:hypothetical protein
VMVEVCTVGETEIVSLLSIVPKIQPLLSRLALAATDVQDRVTVVLLDFKIVEVIGMMEVTPVFAATVTVGPAGIVVANVVVMVAALGVLVLMLVVMLVVF